MGALTLRLLMTLVLRLYVPFTRDSSLVIDPFSQNLDTQYTVGVAGGVPTTFISVGSQNTDGIGGFLDIINFLISEATPPQVLTTSYGFNEPGIPLSIATCEHLSVFFARSTYNLRQLLVQRVYATRCPWCLYFLLLR